MNYETSNEAQIYFNNRLGTEAWDDASETNRTKAIGQATTIIDRLNYLGSKADDEQSNQFPRGDDTTVPQDIKDATSEIALALLDGVSPEMEFENIFMTSQGYGGARSTYDRSVKPVHIVAGVPSFTAWSFLQPYLRDPSNIELYRTS